MICNTNTNTSLIFDSVDAIPAEIWEDLACNNNFYFHPNYLKSLEKNHPEIGFSYIVLIDKNKKPTAIANLKIVDFHVNSIKNDLEFLRTIGKKLHIIPDNKPLKLLICGNIFVSGEHGVFIKKDEDKNAILKELAESINHFLNLKKDLKTKIDAFLMKDFVNESLLITDELKAYNYHPFSVEPNMKLKLPKNWATFDDYLMAMKTKFRVKAKRALVLSKSLLIEDVTLDNIDEKLPKMTALYKKVSASANFNLANFNIETYKDFKEKLGSNYILKTYSINDKIVGFMSGVINQKSLDAHFVGIDYKLNKKYAIYQRMLYDYVEIAIEKKLKTVNFGRTASEIKSSVGAVPQDLTMYLRHKKSITNKILKLFLQYVQPTSFRQKFPFKS
ncbi:GNAT family N-acetyltransferase [Polaribacter sp. M15]